MRYPQSRDLFRTLVSTMPTQERLPGTLGPYRLAEKIGQGGMGVVYLAHDPAGNPVAVKALGPAVTQDPEARRRLAREVDTMRRVRSPYVAEILDADVSAESPYIVTRYVPGQTLDDLVRDHGPLRDKALERLGVGLARALAAIHAAGVVHRDLKPGNVMLVDGHPVVIDFGIAQAAGSSTRLTQTGMVMGTPGYLAPEVIEGKPSSGASDVHSWGATMAFAATGRPPYGSGSFETIFYRIISGRPELGGVPPGLLPLVSAALSSDPDRRPPPAWLASRCVDFDTLPTRQGQTMIATNHYNGALGPSPAQAAAAVADLLPPADYRSAQGAQRRGAPGGALGGAPGIDRADGQDDSRRPRAYWLVSLAFMAAAVAMSAALPYAGTAIVIAGVTLLRAADRAQSALTLRRSARGPRPADVLIVVATAPLTVMGALLRSLLVLPMALIAAGGAAVVGAVFVHADTLAKAGAWAAAGGAAWYCAGLGSKRPRRQLTRMIGAVARTPASFLVAVIACWSLAGAVVVSATSQPPLYWPTVTVMLPHVPSFSSGLNSALHWLQHNTKGFPHIP